MAVMDIYDDMETNVEINDRYLDMSKVLDRDGTCKPTNPLTAISDPIISSTVLICPIETGVVEIPFTPPKITDPVCTDTANFWTPFLKPINQHRNISVKVAIDRDSNVLRVED